MRRSQILIFTIATTLSTITTPLAHSQPLADRLDDLVVYFDKEDASPNEVLRLANKVISLEGKCEAFWRRGWAYSQLERYADAVKDFSKSIEYGCSNDGWTWFEMGVALYMGFNDRYEESVSALTKAIELENDDPNSYQQRGYARWELGQKDLACGDFLAASELGFSDPESHLSELCTDVPYTSAYKPAQKAQVSDLVDANEKQIDYISDENNSDEHSDILADESISVHLSKKKGHDLCLNASDYKGCMEYHNGETAKNNSDEQEDDGPSAEAVGRAIERSLNILQDTFSPSQPTYNRGGFNPGLSNLETNLMQQRMSDKLRQYNRNMFNRAHPNYGY